MAKPERERKLSTILAMDVVNYTAKMGADEEGTLEHLAQCRKIVEEEVSSQKGRIFNTAGDAFMIEFASPVGAVTAATEIQKQVATRNTSLEESERLEFRIGINMGDIIIEGENLFGDGVNVAARLEGISPPGGICISQMIQSVVEGKIEAEFVDQGPQNLKNVEKPVRAFYLELEAGSGKAKTYKPPTQKTALNMKWIGVGGLAVAFFGITIGYFVKNNESQTEQQYNTMLVTPLETLSDDQNQKNFALGLTQDLGNGLTRAAKGLKVVTLIKPPENLDKLILDSEAKFLLSGNLRQSNKRIRVTVNLIDTANMATMWTENLDRDLAEEDVFAMQDDIVTAVVDELVGNGAVLAKNTVTDFKNKGSANLSSYECVNYVRGVYKKTFAADAHKKSLECLRETVLKDPLYTDAWNLLAEVYYWGYGVHKTINKDQLRDALEYTVKAIATDSEDGFSYAMQGSILFHLRDWEPMYEAIEKAIELSPLNAETLGQVAHFLMLGGDCKIEHFTDPEKNSSRHVDGNCRFHKGYEIALRAHKLDKANFVDHDNWALGLAYLGFQDGKKLLKTMEAMPTLSGFYWWELEVGVAHHWLGNFAEAKRYLEGTKELLGGDDLNLWKEQFAYWNATEQNWLVVKPVLKEYGWK